MLEFAGLRPPESSARRHQYGVQSLINFPFANQAVIDTASGNRIVSHDIKIDLLADSWRHDTLHVSSPSRITSHPIYGTLISMGRPVAKRMLERLQMGEAYVHWFLLLRAICKQNPVPAIERGHIQPMADAWLAWGKANRVL